MRGRESAAVRPAGAGRVADGTFPGSAVGAAAVPVGRCGGATPR
jgi:hypothetical protein